jgi:hypothetical protein
VRRERKSSFASDVPRRTFISISYVCIVEDEICLQSIEKNILLSSIFFGITILPILRSKVTGFLWRGEDYVIMIETRETSSSISDTLRSS